PAGGDRARRRHSAVGASGALRLGPLKRGPPQRAERRLADVVRRGAFGAVIGRGDGDRLLRGLPPGRGRGQVPRPVPADQAQAEERCNQTAQVETRSAHAALALWPALAGTPFPSLPTLSRFGE